MPDSATHDDGNEDDRLAGEDRPERDPDSQLRAQGDDQTPLGDTAEGHEEIGPHDLPPDHPGRHEAERLADDRGQDGQESVRTPRS